MTAAALMGFSFSHSFVLLCLWAVPYGLGAGSVDAALNNFVALHYQARHMNWLHCFWGVGASIGPYIMGACLAGGLRWNSGYRVISFIQIALTAILLFSLPLWKNNSAAGSEEQRAKQLGVWQLLSLPQAKPILVAFFCYCSLESTTGLWGAVYMRNLHKISTRLPIKGIKVESLEDYFKYVFIQSRIGRQIDEIRYISDTSIKAVQVRDQQDIVFYYFHKINGEWKLHLPPLED